jgi:hypothetical protein
MIFYSRDEHKLQFLKTNSAGEKQTLFVPKKDAGCEKFKILPNEKLSEAYRSLNTVQMVKSMRLRWAGHTARIEEFWYRNLLENVHLENREEDGRIIIRWILWRLTVDGTGSGSCPLSDFVIGGVEPSSAATRRFLRLVLHINYGSY